VIHVLSFVPFLVAGPIVLQTSRRRRSRSPVFGNRLPRRQPS
jgi:hypothetical protein